MSGLAVVGAAETRRLGIIDDMSEIELIAEAARDALSDAGLTIADVDGIATSYERPNLVADFLGVRADWLDGTDVGGCSPMLHLRHAAAAIAAGQCETVLIAHGESGRSGVGRGPVDMQFTDLHRQFELPYGTVGPTTALTLMLTRYMAVHGIAPETLASVPVVQREWAARNPRAFLRDPITVEDVLASRVIAWPMHILECCVVTDGGGALVVTAADRAKDFPAKPVYLRGVGEAYGAALVSQMEDFAFAGVFERSGRMAFESAGMDPSDIQHLMLYDAFAHIPLFALEALGFARPGEGAALYESRATAPGGRLPVNTTGGGLAYTHTGRYGMYAVQESVRQLRGTAAAQVDGVEVSLAHALGGMFAAAGTAIFSTRPS
ncbi:thiolase [Acuticoccus sp. I52.16.1]|uniref:thiolase C-terminal domain-containing protein n=1 Tax=Acuticoccus sp. I52.16.1 TaxID=2928472 RepID=UPI001FD53DCF|nr:thiolase [Acuticoccus sp. I52.16.1]UOM37259.1 thiolase [Acuticoccus sp. I52.16.1]